MTAIERTSWPRAATSAGTLIQINERQEWDRLASQFKDFNYRHSWTYGVVSAGSFNAKIEHVAVKVGSDLVGLAEVRLKTLPILKTGIAYVGGGPLTRRGRSDDRASLDISLAALREEYINRRGCTLRILPPLEPPERFADVCDSYRASGFQDSPWPPPYRTLVLDINRPAAEVRKALEQKWRNCLNNSERQNLKIRIGNEPELFEHFRQMFNQFIQRKHFNVERGAGFYCDVRARMISDEGYLVALAEADGVPVAGHLSSMLGDTGVSLLAATADAGLKNKAAYLLQWQMILAAQQRGMRYYDLGGIDPESNPGVYHFKNGLRGKEVSIPGPFQASPNGMRATAISAVEKIYRWSRRFAL